jgi:hypothetical protein
MSCTDEILGKGNVALCLSLPGTVVTWFVTGFPDPGKVGSSHAVRLSVLSLARQDYGGGAIWRWPAI